MPHDSNVPAVLEVIHPEVEHTGGAEATTAKISTSQIVSGVRIDREILTCAEDIGRV